MRVNRVSLQKSLESLKIKIGISAAETFTIIQYNKLTNLKKADIDVSTKKYHYD